MGNIMNGHTEENLKYGILKHIWLKGIDNPPQIRIFQLLEGLEGRPEREYYKEGIKNLIDERYLDLEGDFDNESGVVIINHKGKHYVDTFS